MSDTTHQSPPGDSHDVRPDNVVVGPWGTPVVPAAAVEPREEVLRAREALDELKFSASRSLGDLCEQVIHAGVRHAGDFLRQWLEEQSIRERLEIFWGSQPGEASIWQVLDAHHLRLIDVLRDHAGHLPLDCWIRHETSLARYGGQLYRGIAYGLRQRAGSHTPLHVIWNTLRRRFHIALPGNPEILEQDHFAPRGPMLKDPLQRGEARLLTLYSLALIVEDEANCHARANGHREPKHADRVIYWLHGGLIEAGKLRGDMRPVTVDFLNRLCERWPIDFEPGPGHDLAVFKSYASTGSDPHLDPAMHGVVKGIA